MKNMKRTRMKIQNSNSFFGGLIKMGDEVNGSV